MTRRSVGAKTVTSTVLFVGITAWAWRGGLIRLDRLAQLGPWVAFAIGVFAVLAGATVFAVWRLWEKSEHYFGFLRARGRWGDAGPDASVFLPAAPRRFVLARSSPGTGYDFSPRVQLALYVLVFVGVGLMTLGNREVSLLLGVPAQLARPSTDFCAAEPEDTKDFDDPEMRGCRLVLRAYQLGYKKSLGACGKKADDKADEKVCTLRQHDEPYLHYAWRLLRTRTGAVMALVQGQRWRDMRDAFKKRARHLKALARAQEDAVSAGPRAAHHLWTNLPDPHGPRGWLAVGARSDCVERYARMPHLPVVDAAARRDTDVNSILLDHGLGQLLFNPAYRPVVGHCREYHVHWGAPRDACAQLARDPEAFLASSSTLDGVRDVLARRDRDRELGALNRSLAAETDAERRKPVPAVEQIVSFQCFMVSPDAPTAAAVVSTPVTLEGHALVARSILVHAAAAQSGGRVALLQQLANLLSPGFHYDRLASRESLKSEPTSTSAEDVLDAPGYALTKLELLRDTDLFLGYDWLEQRPDLLEVYPFHVHLENFITLFRQQYRLERGRL